MRAAVRNVPAEVLVDIWAEPWTSRGVEPEPRTVTDLRGELAKRVREAMKAAPRSALVPISTAALELGVPQRTLRDQIWRGVREAQRLAAGELALEVPVRTPIRVQLPGSRPDPRVLLHMARARVAPGQSFEFEILGSGRVQTYTRRTGGANWRTSW